MSNEVYGYIEAPKITNPPKYFKELEGKTGIGITQISFSELYNFPKDELPVVEEECVAFIVGDYPGKTNTSYLTDFVDYAPESDIGLPRNGKERLALLIDFFMTMIAESNPRRFVIAITECSQIDEVKNIDVQELENKIYEDFERSEAPPDCIYDVVLE